MTFAKDNEVGTACFIVPLRVSVLFISCFALILSVIAILALLTGDIRFQSNGYNAQMYWVNSLMGAAGLLFGFVGLLGAANEGVGSVRVFSRFLVVKLFAMTVTAVADVWELRQCETWLKSPEHMAAQRTGEILLATYSRSSAAMDTLGEWQVCPWARWAYLIGFAVDFTFWAYCAYICRLYELDLMRPGRFKLCSDAGRKGGVADWRYYGVHDPRRGDGDGQQSRCSVPDEQWLSQAPWAGYGATDHEGHGTTYCRGASAPHFGTVDDTLGQGKTIVLGTSGSKFAVTDTSVPFPGGSVKPAAALASEP